MPDDADSRSVPSRLREYWNARARRSGGDVALAVGLDDPLANACIDAVQRRVLSPALRHVAERRNLDGAAILDLGCGSGRWIEMLGAVGGRYVGVDLASQMLELARVAHPTTPLAAVDGARLPFADASFDLVWTVAAIHHNPYEVQELIVDEMSRVTRMGGAVVLFEGIGARSEATQLYWPRPLQDWMATMRRRGLACVWQRGARYRILVSALERFVARDRWAENVWRRLAGRLDVRLDPHVQSMLPSRYQNRVAMVFLREDEEGEK